ncbi:MAG: hypothetical protein PUP91_36595, partial [Rhizonema sp. PD37]|nr:hypothetical protein [Rhizonema sp. PD37]
AKSLPKQQRKLEPGRIVHWTVSMPINFVFIFNNTNNLLKILEQVVSEAIAQVKRLETHFPDKKRR